MKRRHFCLKSVAGSERRGLFSTSRRRATALVLLASTRRAFNYWVCSAREANAEAEAQEAGIRVQRAYSMRTSTSTSSSCLQAAPRSSERWQLLSVREAEAARKGRSATARGRLHCPVPSAGAARAQCERRRQRLGSF